MLWLESSVWYFINLYLIVSFKKIKKQVQWAFTKKKKKRKKKEEIFENMNIHFSYEYTYELVGTYQIELTIVGDSGQHIISTVITVQQEISEVSLSGPDTISIEE